MERYYARHSTCICIKNRPMGTFGRSIAVWLVQVHFFGDLCARLEVMNQKLKELLAFFPEAELPFTLQEGSEHEFGLNADSIPPVLLDELIYPHLPFEVDEFTEILPGVHWKTSEGCVVLVFWAARLMKYSFVVYSYDREGNWKGVSEVAGFTAFGEDIIRRMARVDDPDTLYVVEGSQSHRDQDVRPGNSRKWEVQVLSSGELAELMLED